MTSIDPINVNTQGIGSSYGYTANSKTNSETASDDKETTSSIQQTPVSADDVLSYMAQSAVSVTPQSTTSVDTSKYVDSASATRIAGFMSDFESKVSDGLAAFDNEFQGSSMSDSAKMAVVLAGINAQA